MSNANSISAIQVYYNSNYTDNNSKQLVGKLVLDGRKPVFGYDKDWLVNGLLKCPSTTLKNRQTITTNFSTVNTPVIIIFVDCYRIACLMVGGCY